MGRTSMRWNVRIAGGAKNLEIQTRERQGATTKLVWCGVSMGDGGVDVEGGGGGLSLYESQGDRRRGGRDGMDRCSVRRAQSVETKGERGEWVAPPSASGNYAIIPSHFLHSHHQSRLLQGDKGGGARTASGFVRRCGAHPGRSPIEQHSLPPSSHAMQFRRAS
jgi:hypothetical protein